MKPSHEKFFYRIFPNFPSIESARLLVSLNIYMLNFETYYELLWEAFDTPTQLLLNPDHDSKTWKEVFEDFKDSGGTMLGAGMYAKTFAHPSWPYILKTFSEDDLYVKYVRWVNKQPYEPAYPKFYGLPQKIVPRYTRPSKSEKVLYVLRMEPLEPMSRNEFDKLDDDWVAYKRYRTIFDDYDAYVARYGSGYTTNELVNIRKVLESVDPMVLKFLTTYHKVFMAITGFPGGLDDWHSGNVMIRPSTGEYVITDPVCGSSIGKKPIIKNYNVLPGGKKHLPRFTKDKVAKPGSRIFLPGDYVKLITGENQFSLSFNKVYKVEDVPGRRTIVLTDDNGELRSYIMDNFILAKRNS